MSDPKYYIPVEILSKYRRQIIKEKENIDKTKYKPRMLKNLFKYSILPIIARYQPIISSLASHNSNLIYRARKCIGNKPFSNLKELYNPPKPTGRARSTDYTPILYASSSHQTCLSEIDVKVGDYVNVISFDYTKIIGGKFWFVGQLETFHRSQEQSRYLVDERTVQNTYYTDERAINSLVFNDSLFKEIFSVLSSDADKYELNRLIIEEIRNKQANKEDFYGVVYVSTNHAPGINFAIFGGAISKIKPSIVNFVKIKYIDDYGNIQYELLENSKPIKDILEWSK
jgi:hypothetical protein